MTIAHRLLELLSNLSVSSSRGMETAKAFSVPPNPPAWEWPIPGESVEDASERQGFNHALTLKWRADCVAWALEQERLAATGRKPQA